MKNLIKNIISKIMNPKKVSNKVLTLREFSPKNKIVLDVSKHDSVEYIPKKPNKTNIEMKVPIKKSEMLKKFEDDNGWNFSTTEYEECIDLLSHVNFYTFKYYAKKENCSSFSDTKKTYYFDKFLQNKIHKITLDIEMGIRTNIVDSLSLYYFQLAENNEDTEGIKAAQFYLNSDLYFTETGKYKRTPKRDKDVLGIWYMFQNTIEKNEKNSNVKKELEEYDAVSAWVLFDLLTLGELAFFFAKLTESKKKVVTKNLNERNILKDEIILPKMLASWLNSIRYIRNKAAHGSKIYGETLNVLAPNHKSDKNYLSQMPINYQKLFVNVLLVCRRIIACLDNHTRTNWNNTLIEIDTEIQKQGLQTERLGLTKEWLTYFIL